jgi:hypothetical protein
VFVAKNLLSIATVEMDRAKIVELIALVLVMRSVINAVSISDVIG